MTEEEVVHMLSVEVRNAGSRTKWAKKHGVHRTIVDRILRGEDKLQTSVLLALGLRRVVTYEKR